MVEGECPMEEEEEREEGERALPEEYIRSLHRTGDNDVGGGGTILNRDLYSSPCPPRVPQEAARKEGKTISFRDDTERRG